MAEKKRILFTGGSGKAGRHVVPYLLARGHRVVNVDLVPLAAPGVDNLTADIADSGQMFDVDDLLRQFRRARARHRACRASTRWCISPPCPAS